MRQLGAHLPEPPAESTPPISHGLEALPPHDGRPWALLDDEPRPHFPFLTVAVPALAAVLAVGALYWSGSLHDRVRQQDQVMSALQQQNKKLADTLEEMTVEQRAASALQSAEQGSVPHSDANHPAPDQQVQQPAVPPASPVAAPPDASATTGAAAGLPGATPPAESPQQVQQPPVPVQATTGAATEHAAPMQGVASEPKRVAKAEEGAHPAQTAPVHAPEIVPPYPTLYAPRPVAGTQGTPVATQQPPTHPTQPVPQPSSPAGSAATTTSQPVQSTVPAATSPRTTTSSAPAVTTPAAAPAAYPATPTVSASNPLAQNIEAVQALQRHSTVPLQEFHVHEGMLTKLTPALGLSVRHPDQGQGTYALVVYAGRDSYQVKGQVNNPLVFTDNSTHRQYELVVMRIANQQIFGYVRGMQ